MKTMKKNFSAHHLALACTFLACSAFASDAAEKADRTQNPSADARWLALIVKADVGVTPLPATLEYESEKCRELRSYGVGGQSQSGSTMMRALNFEHVDLVKEPEGSSYKARFAIDAGGRCEWKLVSLETSFVFKSSHPLAKGMEVRANRKTFSFRDRKDAVRAPNVRMQLPYFPVILVKDDPRQNELRLREKGLFIPPSFAPSASGMMILEWKVFDDKAMLVREDTESRYRYFVTYPDGATGTNTSVGQVGVEDERMQCLLTSGKQNCDQFAPRER